MKVRGFGTRDEAERLKLYLPVLMKIEQQQKKFKISLATDEFCYNLSHSLGLVLSLSLSLDSHDFSREGGGGRRRWVM